MSRRRRHKKLTKEPQPATITGLSHEGRGVTQIEGKTTFVFGALPEEEVRFTYTRTHKQHDEGQAVEVLVGSKHRVDPLCPYFMTCGGCSLQHLASEQQVRHKQSVLLEQFQHMGNVQPEGLIPPLLSPVWGYRRKARLGVKYVEKKQKVLIGFRERQGRFITDMNSCSVLDTRVSDLLPALAVTIEQLSNYNQVPQIEVAVGDQEVALVLRHLTAFTEADEDQLKAFSRQHKLWLFLQPGGVESVHLFYPMLTPEKAYLHYRLPAHQVELQFKPLDFTQVNPHINVGMVDLALQLLELQPEDHALDLFCGLGNFSIPMARYCKTVDAVEGSDEMVQRGRRNAIINSLENVCFHLADLCVEEQTGAWATCQYDKILIDPPRSGAMAMMNLLPMFNASRIVYVSCNPATLARDARALVDHGYRLLKAGVMDMFPHTSHVESIAVFVKS